MGAYASKHGSCNNCPKKPRSLTTPNLNLDNTILLPLKVLFYTLTITLITVMICRQIAKYRDAKKKRAIMMEGGQGYADGVVDVEKAVSF